MRENILSGITGGVTSFLSVIVGWIDVQGIVQAFCVGAAGALGGLAVRYISRLFKQKFGHEKSGIDKNPR